MFLLSEARLQLYIPSSSLLVSVIILKSFVCGSVKEFSWALQIQQFYLLILWWKEPSCLSLNVSGIGVGFEDYDNRNYWHVIFPFIHQTRVKYFSGQYLAFCWESVSQSLAAFSLFFMIKLALLTTLLAESRCSTSVIFFNPLPSLSIEALR